MIVRDLDRRWQDFLKFRSAKREEVRKKISESMKLRWQDPNYSRNKQRSEQGI